MPQPSVVRESYDVLIVGAGHGGAQAAITLKQLGFNGTIGVFTAEPDLPYERPPLTKDYLLQRRSLERMLLRPETFWQREGLTLHRESRIVGINPKDKVVWSEDGVAWRYGALVWAAGGRARRLGCPGKDLQGVHTIRNRADVDAITRELAHVQRAVVIGGGYIGLEAAAALSKLGKIVTLLETMDRVLARVAGVALSRFFEQAHRAEGVEIRLGTSVDCLLESQGRVCGVRLATGEVVPAELAIVGIGIAPCVELLLEAGAAGGNGVLVDEQCRTSLPDVYAIGDCALHRNRFAMAADLVRLESVQNAVDMATSVARGLAGLPRAQPGVPWFWSEQYNLKLQTVGLSADHDATVLRGDPTGGSFSVIYLRSGAVIALDCVNTPQDYIQGRALVLARASVDLRLLADIRQPLKQLAIAQASPVTRM
jgi:3-phenylpropionate/trans-cinnamate dioxygenase ferredoxin reductase subunit